MFRVAPKTVTRWAKAGETDLHPDAWRATASYRETGCARFLALVTAAAPDSAPGRHHTHSAYASLNSVPSFTQYGIQNRQYDVPQYRKQAVLEFTRTEVHAQYTSGVCPGDSWAGERQTPPGRSLELV